MTLRIGSKQKAGHTRKERPSAIRKGDQIFIEGRAHDVKGRRYVAGWNVPERFQLDGHKNGWIFTLVAEGGSVTQELFVSNTGYIEVPA